MTLAVMIVLVASTLGVLPAEAGVGGGFQPSPAPFTLTEYGFPGGRSIQSAAVGPDGRIWTTVSSIGRTDATDSIGAIDPDSQGPGRPGSRRVSSFARK